MTDSSCDLTEGEIVALDIDIVPLSIRFGSDEFTDRQDLSVEEFYERMANSEVLPETACPSPGAFERAFQNAEKGGADAVICLNMSGALSNTLQSAQTASAGWRGRIPIHVVDSKSVSSGLGTLVLAAVEVARAGGAKELALQVVPTDPPHSRVRHPQYPGRFERG